MIAFDDPEFTRGHAPWPAWVRGFRDTQARAIELVLDAYSRGVDVVMLDAPTGTGKTLLAEGVRRAGNFKSALYVCNTIGLQEQFIRDFPYARLIKGRSNYLPRQVPFSAPSATCADCLGPKCDWCVVELDKNEKPIRECPYSIARAEAIAAPLTVTNTAYFIREANHVGGLAGRDLVIADESDTLEGILTGYIEFRVSPRWLGRLKLDVPKRGSHGATVVRWVGDVLVPTLQAWTATEGNDVERGRQEREKATLLQDCKRFLATPIEAWVRDNDAGPLVYRPITCSQWGQETLWKHGAKWLCMSGSIISTREQVRSLGAMGLQVETVEVPMTFPVENRPIYAAGVADMSLKKQAEDMPKMIRALGNVCDRHPGDRILVHCVSYKLADELHRKTQLARPDRPMFTYSNTAGRDDAFNRYAATEGAVLFAASMDRGFDFAGDLARVVVIAKVPFMSLGDRQVSARMNAPGGEEWYAVQAVRTVLQMTGRGVRSADDSCATYILDSQFNSNLYAKNPSMFPKWWKQGIRRAFRASDLLR